ncbi:MAG: N-acetylglucosamine-6-phosphate deacetylase, partial [Thermoprotei archaeon]
MEAIRLSERIVFLNGCLITPFRTLRKGSVIVKGSKIERVGASPDAIPKDAITIDVDGCYILPGFIDIHVHGGAGADAMDASLDAIEKIVNFHAKGGTCSIVLSTVTASKEEILRAIEAVRKAKKELRAGAKILGIHLEGPYLSMKQKGAHNPKYIRDPSPEEYEEFLKYSEDIVRVT